MAIVIPMIENLYPPVIDTYQKAQIYDENETYKIYFSLSDYNTWNNMRHFAQVTITDQESNLSVLNKEKYPSEIMLTAIKIDTNREVDQYYIEISTEDGTFDIDKFYKVQIRFTSLGSSAVPIDWEDPSVEQAIDDWLSANLDYFSEWSRVTLIKWIANNTIKINDVFIEELTDPLEISSSDMNLMGELVFSETSKEYLNKYRIIIVDNSALSIIVDSGYLFTDKNSNNVNEFWYKLKYKLEPGENYTLIVDYQTNSAYEKMIECDLSVEGNSGSDQGFIISAKENQDEGEITVRISKPAGAAYDGDLIIKRASDKDNFTTWEDMYTYKDGVEENKNFSRDWVDQTVESGVLYKYALLESYNNVSYFKEYNKILMLVLNDMYLTIANQQLKIQFNPQVSSFKQVVNEGKIETIGSPYPYIRRNAAINYAQFPISGLISCQMDENENFISKEELYGGKELLRKYEQFNSYSYNEPFMTTIDNDFVYEKKFRDAVMSYLMDGKVKLFRSPSEGNYLVRLTDVSFTPNQQLGRMIWTFNATANEIAANTVENYYKYKILE